MASKAFLLLGVLDDVGAVGPAVGVALGGVGVVLAGAGRVLAVVLEGGLGDGVGEVVVGEELGHVDVVALGDSLADPLGIADDHVEAGAARGPFSGDLVVVGAPGFLHDVDLDAGFLFVQVADFLQVVGRIPLRPLDRQFFDVTSGRSGGFGGLGRLRGGRLGGLGGSRLGGRRGGGRFGGRGGLAAACGDAQHQHQDHHEKYDLLEHGSSLLFESVDVQLQAVNYGLAI